MQWRRQDNNWQWNVSPGVTAWFTTRLGGVSAPPYDTRNLSFMVRDATSSVRENRRRSVPEVHRLVMAEQVHQEQLAWVGAANAGQGAFEASTSVPGVDGLLTTDNDVVLGMGFADCVPIFLSDVVGSMVGILHAGWRGTTLGIQIKAIEALALKGWDLGRLRVGIGPSIGPCCYEVDDVVARKVRDVLGHEETLAPGRDANHFYLDLWTTNRLLLERAGIERDNIDILGRCTACHPEEFFSHRRDKGRTGRMGGFICRTSNEI